MKTTPWTIPKMLTPSSVVSVTYLRNMPVSSSAQVIASADGERAEQPARGQVLMRTVLMRTSRRRAR